MKIHYSIYLDLDDAKPGIKVYVSPERIHLHKLRGNGTMNLSATSDKSLVDCETCLRKLAQLEIDEPEDPKPLGQIVEGVLSRNAVEAERRAAKAPKVHYAAAYKDVEEIHLDTPAEITFHDMSGGRGVNGVLVSGDWDEVTCAHCLGWKRVDEDNQAPAAKRATAVDEEAAERNRRARAEDRGETPEPASAAEASEFPPMDGWETHDVVESANPMLKRLAKTSADANLARLRRIAPKETHTFTGQYVLRQLEANATPEIFVEIKHASPGLGSFRQWFDERGFSAESLDEIFGD